MAEKLTIVIAGEPVIEYDRDKALTPAQMAFLDKVDARLDAGVSLAGVAVEAPDSLQRAQFIALHLVEAIEAGDDARAAASCGYLALRLPELKQVQVIPNPGSAPTIDLVFDKPYAPQATVQFTQPGQGG